VNEEALAHGGLLAPKKGVGGEWLSGRNRDRSTIKDVVEADL